MRRLGANILLTAGALLIAHCSVGPEERAGGDDFPNMIADAGSSITRNLDQQWENPASAVIDPATLVPASLPSLSPSAGAAGKRSLLSKTKAADSIWYAVDLPAGTISLFSRKDTLLSVKNDTLIFKVNGTDTIVVSYTGAIVTKNTPVITDRYRYTDYDGDGLLYSSAASTQQILAELVREGPDDRVQLGRIVLDAGPDGDFDTESDNRAVFAEAVVTEADDTISLVTISDADGDGFATDNGVDSGLVNLVTIASAENPVSLLRRTGVAARMVVFPTDSFKNYAIRYQVINTFVVRTVQWNILGKNGDSTFFPGDTVDVIRSTVARDDSLDCDTMKIRALLGDNPRDSLDDAIIGIYLHLKYLRGDDREVIFEYSAETPIPSGGKPDDGTVYYKSAFRDDSWIEVEGILDGTVITADVTVFRTDAQRYTVTWDYAGKVVSFERVE